MPLRNVFVIGRGGRKGSARFMHALVDGQTIVTICGVDTAGWSRSFVSRTIADKMHAILCRNCTRRLGIV